LIPFVNDSALCNNTAILQKSTNISGTLKLNLKRVQKEASYQCAGLGNQSCDVVLVKGAFTLEEPQGVGISE
jgi:hypothetical protein